MSWLVTLTELTEVSTSGRKPNKPYWEKFPAERQDLAHSHGSTAGAYGKQILTLNSSFSVLFFFLRIFWNHETQVQAYVPNTFSNFRQRDPHSNVLEERLKITFVVQQNMVFPSLVQKLSYIEKFLFWVFFNVVLFLFPTSGTLK